MDRRQFLLGSGAAIGLGGSYLGWNRYRSPSTPDGVSVDTRYFERDVLVPPNTGGLPSQAVSHALFGDAETATDELEDLDAVTAFVEGTEFDDSFLVLVQTGMQSEPDLVLESITRLDDGLGLEAAVDAPWFGVNDDLATHSLLVRITDEEYGLPDTLSVDVDGYV